MKTWAKPNVVLRLKHSMFQKWTRFNEILSYVFDARFGGIQYTSVYGLLWDEQTEF